MTTDESPDEPRDRPHDERPAERSDEPPESGDDGEGVVDQLPAGKPAPSPASPRKRAIAALAANIGVLLFCSPLFGMLGIVVAVIGLARATSRPESARLFVRWAWIIFGLALILATILNIWIIATRDDSALTPLLAGQYV